MSLSRFVHLHVHSEYSLLDGACRLQELVQAAKNMNMTHLALTDHGSMHGVLEFYKLAAAAGIQPIIGMETYVTPGSRFDKKAGGDYSIDDLNDRSNFHLILLAKDEEGYRNLMRLSSIAHLEGFYYKPRVDHESIKEYSQGLIGLSACLKGEIPFFLRENRWEEAKQLAQDYHQIFGEGNFYLEVQYNGLPEQNEVNRGLRALSDELSIPLVATTDVHYLKPEDAKTQDCLICIGTKKTLNDPKRLRIATQELYLKSGEALAKQLPDFQDAVENTWEAAQRCKLEIKTKSTKLYMPQYQIPQSETSHEEYLRKLVQAGAKERYGAITPELQERIDRELNVIITADFTGYFLIVWDYIKFAREQGISVGPGRGSAAGSVVAYSLHITDIDPIQHGLLFERFLNPDRISPPDIDTDFSDQRRDEVIRYVQDKYGKDRVAQIATFGTIGAKNAVRDVARVLGLAAAEGDRIAKLIPDGLGVTLDDALKDVPELRRIRDQDAIHQELFRLALAIEGMVRQTSTHAAGVIIAPDSLWKFTPLMRGANKEQDISTQFEMKSLESIGLLKMDFLGLKNLSVIDGAVQIIRERYDRNFDINRIPMDDSKTYQLLGRAKTNGVFQLESTGLKDILRRFEPETFSDIVTLIALYRPGPLGSGMVEDFIRRKKKEEAISYDHPSLEPILRETYGTILYQEQVMQIANVIAGLSLGQADIMRRAMGKKDAELLAKLEANFISGAEKNSVSKTVAHRLWSIIQKFASYGFNKSHSAAYAVVTYRTAYLKANYPGAFLASLLTTEMNDTNKIVKYTADARDFGIEVLPPDINQSKETFTVTEAGIRFGLAAIKNVGIQAVISIIRERENQGPYKSLYDFCERSEPGILNRSLLESLIQAGTFDSLGHTRATLLALYPSALERAQGILRDRAVGQSSLFGEFEAEDTAPLEASIERLPELETSVILQQEKKLLGMYITGHPLAEYDLELRLFARERAGELTVEENTGKVRLAGIVTEVKKRKIKNKSGDKEDFMAVMILEDMSGSVEVAVMPNLLQEREAILIEDAIVIVEGTASPRGDKLSVRADRIYTLEEGWQQYVREVHIPIQTTALDDQRLLRLREQLMLSPGKTHVILHIHIPAAGTVQYELEPTYSVQASREFKLTVDDLIQNGEVYFVGPNGNAN